MKRQVAVFLCTVFIFTCCIDVRLQVPSRPRLVVSGIFLAGAMVCLVLSKRENEITDP